MALLVEVSFLIQTGFCDCNNTNGKQNSQSLKSTKLFQSGDTLQAQKRLREPEARFSSL